MCFPVDTLLAYSLPICSSEHLYAPFKSIWYSSHITEETIRGQVILGFCLHWAEICLLITSSLYLISKALYVKVVPSLTAQPFEHQKTNVPCPAKCAAFYRSSALFWCSEAHRYLAVRVPAPSVSSLSWSLLCSFRSKQETPAWAGGVRGWPGTACDLVRASRAPKAPSAELCVVITHSASWTVSRWSCGRLWWARSTQTRKQLAAVSLQDLGRKVNI